MLTAAINISNALQQNSAWVIALATVLGLMVGSFLNVVIHRLPKMMEREWHKHCLELQGKEPVYAPSYTLSTPRSACPICGHKISAWENIPVISYLLLKGRCHDCKTPISLRYPLIEALTGGLLGLISWKFGYTATTVFACLLCLCLIVLTFIDLDTQLLPDNITLPLLWLGLAFNLNGGFANLKSAVIGAMAGYLMLWSIHCLFKFIRGKEGMGCGDFKLFAALGAWFGWQWLPAVILFASTLGVMLGMAMMMLLSKHDKNTPMPFGPFLAIGGMAVLFLWPLTNP